MALADRLGREPAAAALRSLDALYPQENGQSPLQQLQAQPSNPLPYDLEQTVLFEYKNLAQQWRDWRNVQTACAEIAVSTFDGIAPPLRSS